MIVVEQFKRTDLTNRAMASVYFHMGVSSMVTFLCLEVARFGGLALTFGGSGCPSRRAVWSSAAT